MTDTVEPATPATVSTPVAVADPPAATAATPTPEPAAATPAADPQDVASLPAFAQKLIHDLREESATKRTKLTTLEQSQKDTMDKIAAALGLKPEDDPAKAAQTAADERDVALKTAQEATKTLAVYRLASKAGANSEALTDSRSFMLTLESIDPAASDFAAQVETAIKAAVEANPSLKTAPVVPARSGGPVGGGVPVEGQLTAEDVALLRKEGRDAEIVEAKAKGRLNTLLGIS